MEWVCVGGPSWIYALLAFRTLSAPGVLHIPPAVCFLSLQWFLFLCPFIKCCFSPRALPSVYCFSVIWVYTQVVSCIPKFQLPRIRKSVTQTFLFPSCDLAPKIHPHLIIVAGYPALRVVSTLNGPPIQNKNTLPFP